MKFRSFSALVAGLCLFAGVSHADAALLLHYTFDGGNANDTGTGTAANGTVIGATSGFTTNTPGGSGQAFSTGTGVNEYLTTGTSGSPDTGPPAKLTSLNAFTITLWVNLQAVPGGNDRLISTLDTGLTNGIDFRIASGTSTSFTPFVAVDGGSASGSPVNANLNTWVFLALTYDGILGSANAKLYSGGVSTLTTQLGATLTVAGGPLSSTGTAFQVGGTGATANDRSPSAFFDDVRVYDTILTQTELNDVRLENVPEPSALALVGLSLAGVLVRRRR